MLMGKTSGMVRGLGMVKALEGGGGGANVVVIPALKH